MTKLPRDRRKLGVTVDRQRPPAGHAPAPSSPAAVAAAAPVSTSGFPMLRITGGPHGKDARVTIDGVAPPKVHRVELEIGVDDVVRAKIFQMVEISVDVETPVIGSGFIAKVRAPDIAAGVIRTWSEVAAGKGETIRAAVMAAAEAIPEGFEIPGAEPAPEEEEEVVH